MPVLKIVLESQNEISFLRGDHISDDVWQKIVNWWSSEIIHGNPGQGFTIAVSTFELRKHWLRDYWKSLGYEIELDTEIISRLKEHSKQVSQFTSLAFNEYRPNKSDIDSFSPNLLRPLKDFQKSNVLTLLRMPHGANFSVPGAGKTATQLSVFQELVNGHHLERMVVVCPKSSFEAWRSETITLFEKPPILSVLTDESIDSKATILLVNYEQLENANKLSRVTKWMTDTKSCLVLDEAHRVKGGGGSTRWRACSKLAALAVRTDLLTGTPLPQGYEDLRNLLKLSWNHLPEATTSVANLHQLRVNGIFVRTTKSDLGLPPITIREVPLGMSPLQSQIYSALGRAYIGQLNLSAADTVEFRRRGKAVFTLLAAASNPGLLMGKEGVDSYLNFEWPPKAVANDAWLKSVLENYVKHEVPAKYTWIANLVKIRAVEKKKIIIWSNFIGNLTALDRLLKPYNPAVIFGATSADDRVAELSRFRNSADCHVLITNPQTLGEGISLHQVCHEAVYMDRSYNAGHYLQSVDRIHRLGLAQEQTTTIHFLVSERSIDERVQLRLQAKIERLGRIMGDHGLVPGTIPNADEDAELYITGLDAADYHDLFNHLKTQN